MVVRGGGGRGVPSPYRTTPPAATHRDASRRSAPLRAGRRGAARRAVLGGAGMSWVVVRGGTERPRELERAREGFGELGVIDTSRNIFTPRHKSRWPHATLRYAPRHKSRCPHTTSRDPPTPHGAMHPRHTSRCNTPHLAMPPHHISRSPHATSRDATTPHFAMPKHHNS